MMPPQEGIILALIYGAVSYVVFLAVFLYAIGFVGDLVVPKAIDSGSVESTTVALVITLLLLSAFAIHHSGMARQGFKEWWTRVVPRQVERSTYVLLASRKAILNDQRENLMKEEGAAKA